MIILTIFYIIITKRYITKAKAIFNDQDYFFSFSSNNFDELFQLKQYFQSITALNTL